MPNIQCHFCEFKTGTISKFINHTNIHTNQRKLFCPVSNCGIVSKSVTGLRNHLYRCHRKGYDEIKPGNKFDSSDYLKCNVEACGIEQKDWKTLISHLRKHIDHGFTVLCPICSVSFSTKPAFSVHLSRTHYREKQFPLICNVPDLQGVSDDVPSTCNDSDHDIIDNIACITESADIHGLFQEDDVKKNSALFFLRLQSELLLSSSTVTKIVSEIDHLSKINTSDLTSSIKEILSHDESLCNEVVKIVKNSVLTKTLLHFSSDHKRLSTYENLFCIVKPTEKSINYILGLKKLVFSYINLSDTLKVLLSKPTVSHQLQNPLHSKPNVIADYSDGTIGKKLLEDKSLILLLYCDEFEICNPIGSAKKKHKLIAFYYTLLNLYPWNRSKTSDIQLLLLAKSEEYNKCPDSFLEPLVTELKFLEKNGLEQDNVIWKVRLFAISGDNLGSNSIGGFQTSFSIRGFFCRFCTSPPVESRNLFNQFNLRTPDNYNSALTQLTDGLFEGIKRDSLFNSLEYFHVCQPGLPPCAAHDILEGIAKVDLPLFVNQLVSDKKLSYDDINKALRDFDFLGNDAINKPCPVTANKQSLVGTAAEVWKLIRFAPIILKHVMHDSKHKAWESIVLLNQICTYVFAPQLSIEQVSKLNYLIESYLHMREVLFPNVPLKPKHHLICHYAYLFCTFGPLVNVWTMRFESKHQYFKKIMRTSKNFINVTSTLAKKHQLLQAYSHACDSELREIEISSCESVFTHLLPEQHQHAINEHLNNLPSIIQTTDTLLIRNIAYKVGMIVEYESTEHFYGLIVRILLLSHHLDGVLFLVSGYNVLEDSQGYICLNETNDLHCISASQIISPEPLELYKIDLNSFVVPKTVSPLTCL